ncbi:TonB-dependent siderophore receptor [Arcobacter sp. CECT 8983]|uniref:TonB-dependent siderophore receptor n=1 Tax=Arcobacter sp. CECT 8983 TaxID=2044508 RepID=UPI00100AB737|nr:TonB-dependent siderophore receptor [Arcobacter sp. CECT 8983]RXJ88483.1 TonB-dependent siderophore receptor [Arcobacter sp. CECT 8983]
MKITRSRLTKLSLLTALILQTQVLAKETEVKKNNLNTLDSVMIYGEQEKTTSATKLDMTIFETPQAVSVVSDIQIDDYNLTDTASALEQVSGVRVERTETDRTYYNARGFNIVNFQYDGVGVPTSGTFHGIEDMSAYEQVEVVKGATSIISSLSNPSATVNFVRKKPTDETKAYISTSYGSWNQKRIEGDVSGTIIDDKLKGRFVIAKQKGDSYLDRYSSDITSFYGVLTSDLTDTTKVTFGHSINDNDNKGISSGALPLFYSDGTKTDYDVSTNTAPDWARKELTLSKTFLEIEQDITTNWLAKAIYSHNKLETDWDWFYLDGNPNKGTNTGLSSLASRYEEEKEVDVIDVFASGYFKAFGKEHKVVFGVNHADIDTTAKSIYPSTGGTYFPIGGDWMSGNTPKPTFYKHDPKKSSTDTNEKQTAYYISSRLNILDNLSILLGARAIDIRQDGISYGASQEVDENEVASYIGAAYEVIPGTMLFSSYSEVFNSQSYVNESLSPLGAVEGKSFEAGIKQELNDGNAILSLSYFKSEQENLGEYVSQHATGLNIYKGISVESDGFELELAGEVSEGLNLSMGYTYINIKDEDGNKARRYIPKKEFKLSSAYQLSSAPLRVGASLRWQSEIYSGDNEAQDSYALINTFARYKATKNLSINLNINNITDEEYKLTAQWGQSNYGAPRNATINLKYTF